MAVCSKCNIDQPLDQYYTYWHSTQQSYRIRKVCRNCFNEQQKKYKQSIKNKKIVQPDPPELQPDPFELFLKHDKNSYGWDNYQKEVYDILTSIGWKYNHLNNIWWKLPLRDSDGNFYLPESKYLLEDKPIKQKVQKNQQVINKMLVLRKQGWSLSRIADKFDIKESTVQKWISDEKKLQQ